MSRRVQVHDVDVVGAGLVARVDDMASVGRRRRAVLPPGSVGKTYDVVGVALVEPELRVPGRAGGQREGGVTRDRELFELLHAREVPGRERWRDGGEGHEQDT